MSVRGQHIQKHLWQALESACAFGTRDCWICVTESSVQTHPFPILVSVSQAQTNVYFLQTISQTPYADPESHSVMVSRSKCHLSQVFSEHCSWPVLCSKYTTKHGQGPPLCRSQLQSSWPLGGTLPSSWNPPHTPDCGHMRELAEYCPQAWDWPHRIQSLSLRWVPSEAFLCIFKDNLCSHSFG